jgi:7 transmembrane helices usually fused to an inactive transglutaminase
MLSAHGATPASRRAPTRDQWRFLLVMLVPVAAIEVCRLRALPTAPFLSRHLTLLDAPRGLQQTLDDILLVPIGALVVVTFRLTLGIHVLGPFRSILLAFAFLVTGIWLGLLFLAVTVAILVVIRPLIKSLRLPYFGRVSVMISTVALVMVAWTLIGGWLSAPSLRNLAHFPIVVLVLVGEKVAVTIRKQGTRTGLWRATTTALIGVVLTGIASIPGLDRLLRGRPELILVEIAMIVIVSTVCQWRLLQSLNPRPQAHARGGVGRSAVAGVAASSRS